MGSRCASCAELPAWAGVSPVQTSHLDKSMTKHTTWDMVDTQGGIGGDQESELRQGGAGGNEQVLTRILVPICSRSASSAPMCAISVRLSWSSAASCSSDSCTRSCASAHHGQCQAAPAQAFADGKR